MTILTDSDIANLVQMKIDRAYTSSQREQMARGTAADKSTLKTFYAEMTVLKGALVKERNLLVDVIAYEAAVSRLALDVLVSSKDVPAKVDVTDVTGKTTKQPNPLLVADADERAAAQAIITGAAKATVTLAKERAKAVPLP